MSALARALLAELDPEDLRELAQRLAPYLPTSERNGDDGWLDTRRAAAYLGMSTAALHRLTAERAIPFEQAKPGAKCYFRRRDLDQWRQGDNSC